MLNSKRMIDKTKNKINRNIHVYIHTSIQTYLHTCIHTYKQTLHAYLRFIIWHIDASILILQIRIIIQTLLNGIKVIRFSRSILIQQFTSKHCMLVNFLRIHIVFFKKTYQLQICEECQRSLIIHKHEINKMHGYM